MHVAVNHLKVVLEAVEHCVERRLIASEVRPHEIFKDACIAILRTPETCDLSNPALNARALPLAILCDQLFLHLASRLIHPGHGLPSFLRASSFGIKCCRSIDWRGACQERK